ncbi:ras GTPase-activating-like protein IQGAP3 [Sphaerodactylus townsendi]|uniref:ras GTPase-activating-like protein IQGAP3 n=1 Tax=Sphaerodactylus townsendi TaxID=933632 RepID=UPI002025D79A|nr:ras GTPase-activating-like protein IQGAP3 [Sphaerodactylus townsendi]
MERSAGGSGQGLPRSGYERLTADEMDEKRRQNEAYQYLCRLEEAKRWMETCLKEDLALPTELEESLRNGVILAKLGHFFAPDVVPLRKIYDLGQARFKACGLHYRHTDNINYWREAMSHIGLPAIFHPETTDIYDKKNMPRVVYCIHALSLYLFKLGLAPQIQDLYGKVNFTGDPNAQCEESAKCLDEDDSLCQARKLQERRLKGAAYWRGCRQRRRYLERLQYLRENTDAVIKIQAWVRMRRLRKRYLERLRYFRKNVKAIIKIQAFVRANKARGDYRMLVHSRNPPLSIVRRFAHLLERSQRDYWEELELLDLQESVVRGIRSNQQLESDLNLMDIKIGLLVKNRITLQEVVSHCKKLTRKNKEQLSDLMGLNKQKGLKALSKEKRETLEAYQHLFYQLQTHPLYLARLIMQMPQNKSTKFMESVVFTLFNYASNAREAYLLLQLFQSALQEEIRLKVDRPSDILTGNPTVIRLVVSFYRNARGQNALRQILGGAVQEVLQNKALSIRTSPVEIYKGWVNQMESQTGQKSNLPYDVSPEQALTHFEVQRRLDISIRNLLAVTDKFLSAILTSVDKIPYGMRYIAKVLKVSLTQKFPHAPEEDIYKIVGNLLYYRFMNPAVVAPDGFDIVDISAGVALHPDHRRNLGSIAKILQHAVANQMFEGENSHLKVINQYLEETHLKFSLTGESVRNGADGNSEQALSQLANTEISLTLASKFDGAETDVEGKDIKSLLLSTKQMLVDVIQSQPGDSLMEILRTKASEEQEVLHHHLMKRRALYDAQAPDKLRHNRSLAGNSFLSIEEKKRKVIKNLRRLESLGMVDSANQYQEIINEMAKDIRNQRQYRQHRKAELVKLQQTLHGLNSKRMFYEEQVDYYNQYIRTCLDNLTVKNKPSKKQTTLHYTAARLFEKGVLLEIEDLPVSQLRNVIFDIVPCGEAGQFQVKAKFMGIDMEKFQLQYQDLLQLQYEGVAIMKMFDKARINVNLLIFLLNKKFFKK